MYVFWAFNCSKVRMVWIISETGCVLPLEVESCSLSLLWELVWGCSCVSYLDETEFHRSNPQHWNTSTGSISWPHSGTIAMNTIRLADLEGIPEIKSGFLILQETGYWRCRDLLNIWVSWGRISAPKSLRDVSSVFGNVNTAFWLSKREKSRWVFFFQFDVMTKKKCVDSRWFPNLAPTFKMKKSPK